MKTSYFGNPKLASLTAPLYRISLKPPRFFKLKLQEIPILFPPPEVLELQTIEESTKAYITHLEKNKQEIIETIRSLPSDAILLCFESLKKEGQYCHRRIFADWWYQQTNEKIEKL